MCGLANIHIRRHGVIDIKLCLFIFISHTGCLSLPFPRAIAPLIADSGDSDVA